MFQRGKQQPLPNARLPKLPADPGFDDLQYLLGQAQRECGRAIELPWTSTVTGSPFMLAVRCETSGGDPQWTMHAGVGELARVLWTYQTGDLQLVVNLVLAESAGGQLQDHMQQGSYAAAPKPPASGAPEPGAAYAQTVGAPAAAAAGQTVSQQKAKAILEGDLTNMQLPNLLQSVVMSKMTGRLGIQNSQGQADVFFEDGVPLHAQVGTSQGDQGVVELITWEEGQFHFYPGERTTHRSVGKRLDLLLMEGVALLDQSKYLKSAGVKMESYLMRRHKTIKESDFEQTVSRGAPIDLALQKQVYQSIDNTSTLFDILRRLPLARAQWTPVLFNLITCDLVAVTDRAPVVTIDKPAPLEALGIDRASIQAAVAALQRPETGLFTYPAFLYFLEQEHFRFQSFGWPYSVIIFEMRFRPHGPQDAPLPMTTAAVKEIARRISAIKRGSDLLAHYETFDYACLLPNTTAAAAGIFAGRIMEVVRGEPVPETPDPRSITLALGVSCVPDDCRDLGLMLAAARKARDRAKEQGVPFLLYKDSGG